MARNRPGTQIYEHYTKEDFLVWQSLFERQMGLLHDQASPVYLESLKLAGFSSTEIPRFEEVNQRLKQLTGWQLTVVQGHVAPADFFALLAKKIFPATCWLRTIAELDYIGEPDMFHDVFGHVPLLVNEAYAAFMQTFGRLALAWHNDPDAIKMWNRIYWFTIEFGLINEGSGDKIYGAGILSSPGETKFSMGNKAVRKSFDTVEVLATTFRTDVLQEKYFIVKSFSQLNDVLEEVQQALMKSRFERLHKSPHPAFHKETIA